MDNTSLIMLLVIAIIAGIYMWKKKKKNAEASAEDKIRAPKTELQQTVKKFLKDNGEVGKEIVESFVAKRPDPHNTSQMTKQQKSEYREKQNELKKLKDTSPEKYKEFKEAQKEEKARRQPDLFVITFKTKNPKTGIIDDMRAIECEVKETRPSKKEPPVREVIIKGVVDLEKESSWIKPLMDADREKYEKQKQRIQKSNDKKLAKSLKKSQKEKMDATSKKSSTDSKKAKVESKSVDSEVESKTEE